MVCQRGFALLQVIVLTLLVAGIIYAMILSQDVQSVEAAAEKIAVEVTPAAYAIIDYALTNEEDIEGSSYFDEYYYVSSSYKSSLNDVGFDISSGVSADYTSTTT